tara:strand:+ start:193 stop:654 length:462 start_codon:yes stop_codon:yes gene_type:complete
MKQLISYFIFIIVFTTNSFSEITKPSKEIKPDQVVKIQLKGLMDNNNPYTDIGIEQTWEFAHPKNKKFTGPLEKFKKMIKGDSFNMLVDHKEHEIKQVYLNENVATFLVTILDSDKNYYKFKWQVEKYNDEGPLKDCWLTTAVSQPVSLGSSI